jgi:hypothetical protein
MQNGRRQNKEEAFLATECRMMRHLGYRQAGGGGKYDMKLILGVVCRRRALVGKLDTTKGGEKDAEVHFDPKVHLIKYVSLSSARPGTSGKEGAINRDHEGPTARGEGKEG